MTGDKQCGELLIQGKTKEVYSRPGTNEVVVVNKDRITAGDGVRAHTLEGKAGISNSTNGKVFEFLNNVGIKTSWIRTIDDTSYAARRCNMIPIEWVTRRVATGSFIRRHTGIKEGLRFTPLKLETCYKDDENHDPIWSMEQVLEAGFKMGDITIGRAEYDLMAKTTITVFEVLERAWGSLDCALIDMKIEFGVDSETQEILVSDVIDSDSWRLWPSGDKRLMKDKQVYRNLEAVTDEALAQVKRNFQWVSDKLDSFITPIKGLVVILMGSFSDVKHCKKIMEKCKNLSVPCEMRVTSAHKTTQNTLDIVHHYEGLQIPVVFIAVAGRSNGLGPVVSANSTCPVINCPPVNPEDKALDIWSSLNIPSGLGCSTVVYPEAAAQHAATILALNDHIIWSKLRSKQLQLWKCVQEGDKQIQNDCIDTV